MRREAVRMADDECQYRVASLNEESVAVAGRTICIFQVGFGLACYLHETTILSTIYGLNASTAQ